MIKLKEYCVCLADLCINLPVLPFIIREYHLEVLELLGLLQCLTVYF